MTTLRLIGRIFGYGVPIALILLYSITAKIHWPQWLLATDLGYSILFIFHSTLLFLAFVLDWAIPSKSDPSPDPGHKENQNNH